MTLGATIPSNSFSGSLDWNSIRTGKEGNKSYKERVRLDVNRTNNFKYDEKSIHYDERNKVLCTLIGQVHALDKLREEYSITVTNDVEVLSQIYSIEHLEIYKKIEGFYIILFVDEVAGKAYILHSEYGAPLPLYYTSTKDYFIFSTTLKYILKNADMKRELDHSSARDFLFYQRFIPNESTLVKDVKKLCPHTYMEIDFKSCHVNTIPIHKDLPRATKKDAKTNLLNSLSEHIGNLLNDLKTKDITLTLTGGWDSNIYLHMLREMTDAKIYAATIDGGRGASEIPVVELILKEYEDVEHLTGIVGPDISYSLPNIVWVYDGFIFQEGIFLRYELAKILHNNNCTSVFLGSCTDQIISQGYRSPFQKALKYYRNFISGKNSSEMDLRSQFQQKDKPVKFHIPITFNLKLHDIMLNGFGVQGLFPVVNDRTYSLATKVKKMNFRKKYFIELIKNQLDSKISDRLGKSGHMSDVSLLLEANKPLLMKTLETEAIKRILNEKQINTIKENPNAFPTLILQLTYIHLFNELFISGNFDDEFDNSLINSNLGDFF